MIRKASVATLVGAFALTACTTGTPPERDPNDKTRTGALVGAGIGAVLGAITGDTPEERRRRASVGAIIGAGAGAIAGNSLDKQEADLRRDLGNGDVTITNTGDRLIVSLPQDILFATDSDVVGGALQSDLRALANNLRKYPDTTIQVIGHTDNVGSASYNQGLSERRAIAVSSVLINAGVSARRIQSFGRGESQPIASNLSAEGRAQNRRVEVVILPNA